jgi:Tfp pilus assembly protein PilV
MTARRISSRRGDGGSTLIEVLLATAILGLGITAVLGGMMTSTTASDIARQQAETEAVSRAVAEAVAYETYVNCASSYAASGYTPPGGFTVAIAVQHWNPTSSTFTATGSGCPATDSGLQRVQITVTTSDSRGRDVLLVAKRARPAGEPTS